MVEWFPLFCVWTAFNTNRLVTQPDVEVESDLKCELSVHDDDDDDAAILVDKVSAEDVKLLNYFTIPHQSVESPASSSEAIIRFSSLQLSSFSSDAEVLSVNTLNSVFFIFSSSIHK